MIRLISALLIVVSAQLTLISCQSSTKHENNENNQEENGSAKPISSEKNNTSSANLESEEAVKEYLSDAGFMMSINGKEIIREDQLTEANPSDLVSSISTLEQDKEKNKMTVFYLKVAGAALDDQKASQNFIDEQILDDEEYLEQVDRMTKFLQRQDRPTIKKALIATINQMSDEQCIAYLQKIGYVSGSSDSGFSYEPKALKPIPIFVKIAITDKLRKANGDGALICDRLKVDLGIAS